jgi:hypothetical protein
MNAIGMRFRLIKHLAFNGEIQGLQKWLKRIAAIALTAVLAGAALLWYVKPSEPLGLAYEPVSFRQKIAEMAKSLEFSIDLTEQELDDLMKQKLAERAQLSEKLRVTGARLEQNGTNAAAYINLMYAERFPIGAVFYFQLEWAEPDLVIRHTGTRIRGFDIPLAWIRLDPVFISLGQQLPPFIAVKKVTFHSSGATISFGLK